jgi:hypothetical protein
LDYVFVGADGAADVAGYAFDVLLRQCKTARTAHVRKQSKNCKPSTKAARGDAFAIAWVYGVADVVAQFAGMDRTAAIARYMERKHPEMTNAKIRDRISGRNVKDQDREEGYEAGRKAQINRGVGAATPLPIG